MRGDEDEVDEGLVGDVLGRVLVLLVAIVTAVAIPFATLVVWLTGYPVGKLVRLILDPRFAWRVFEGKVR